MEQIVRQDLRIKIGKLHIRIDAIRKMDDDFLDLLVRAGMRLKHEAVTGHALTSTTMAER
jgi:hypothetical protein